MFGKPRRPLQRYEGTGPDAEGINRAGGPCIGAGSSRPRPGHADDGKRTRPKPRPTKMSVAAVRVGLEHNGDDERRTCRVRRTYQPGGR